MMAQFDLCARTVPPKVSVALDRLREAARLLDEASRDWISDLAAHRSQDADLHITHAIDAIRVAAGVEEDYMGERGL